MTIVHRVLSPKPVTSLDDYVTRYAGGEGLRWARLIPPSTLIDLVDESGLRGRGGAGFPTGLKWRTVRANASSAAGCTVVVNAAEGEPGTFKDRTILRCNPYHVLEGALIAAHAVGANKVVVALKASFTTEVARVATAIEELQLAGWTGQLEVALFEGPDAYLYGEETALLEALEGRPPFPRIAPPYRRGVSAVAADGVLSDSGLSARVHMAGAGADIDAVPALVDNVETLANVPKIVERGPAWFRTEGTEGSPGTVVCTVTGCVATPGVGEVLMGTTIREAIDQVGGGSLPGHEPVAVLPGVSGALIGVEHFDTPMTYEAMVAIGSGLGSAGFLVLDETSDPVAVVAGVSRFLAVESCGQCSPCKQDGLMLAELLEALASSRLPYAGLQRIRKRTTTVATGARCGLATQQQVVVDSLLRHFPTVVEAHAERSVAPVRPEVIAELVSIDGGGVVVDVGHAAKQPDWTFDADWSGSTPVELATDHSRLKQGR